MMLVMAVPLALLLYLLSFLVYRRLGVEELGNIQEVGRNLCIPRGGPLAYLFYPLLLVENHISRERFYIWVCGVRLPAAV